MRVKSKSLLNSVGKVDKVLAWVEWVKLWRGWSGWCVLINFWHGSKQMAWVAWVHEILAWVTWVAWVHEILAWVKKSVWFKTYSLHSVPFHYIVIVPYIYLFLIFVSLHCPHFIFKLAYFHTSILPYTDFHTYFQRYI